ncbi:hypothetical protein JNW88_08125 [Micromonospora sp. ATA32]|nr:hypothetical protein [Micromonospora sp. ATA32]
MSSAVLSAPVTKAFGQVTITASRAVDGGYAINVFTGAVRHSALCYTTADRELYRARYAAIRDAALAGKPAEQIAAGINGQASAAVDSAERIVDNVLAELAAHGRHRQVRPTMAGAHLAAPSDPAQRVLRAAHANGGTIARSKAATVVQLQSLARKGLVTLNYQSGTGRRRVVESATLTEHGRKAVA